MKKMMLLIVCLTICFYGFASKEKYDFDVKLIPDSLKKDANAVVRMYNISYDYKTQVTATERKSVAITIMNNNGLDYANFLESGDKFRKLTKVSGKVYDSKGFELKSYSKADIKKSAYSQHLATDNFSYYLQIYPSSFPFTVHFECEFEWKDGIILFPPFVPQPDYQIAVMEANYSLQYPESTTILTKTHNQVRELPAENSKGKLIRKWRVSNLAAIKEERFSPAIQTLIPIVYAAPATFVYEKTQGQLLNAEHICKWQQELNTGKDELSPETKNTIAELVKDASTDREKVKILYDYLGSITRYESIQLGIGGFQPIPAAEVCRTGFGDCKGLSNLLKAMLNQVNIPANYVIIRMSEQEKDLDDDFSAFIRTNHIVLRVPLPGDTLWLECTNTRVPFGFVHNGISGHNALITTEDGGYMTRLPDYPDSLNLEHNQMNIKINADGSAHVQVEKSWHVKIYDNVDYLVIAKPTEVTDYLRKEISLPHATVSQVSLDANKSALPSLKATYEWTTPSFGTKTANRLLIPVNAMRYTISKLKKGQRKQDIHIKTGWKDTDLIAIDIPEGYEIEALPAYVKHSCAFGNFESTIINLGNKLLINQSVMVHSGQYDVSLYADFVHFIEKITEIYQSKITLKKTAQT